MPILGCMNKFHATEPTNTRRRHEANEWSSLARPRVGNGGCSSLQQYLRQARIIRSFECHCGKWQLRTDLITSRSKVNGNSGRRSPSHSVMIDHLSHNAQTMAWTIDQLAPAHVHPPDKLLAPRTAEPTHTCFLTQASIYPCGTSG